MSIVDLKFADADFAGEDLASFVARQGSGYKVTGKGAELIAQFDNLSKKVIAKGRFNDLIDGIVSEYLPKTGGNITGDITPDTANTGNLGTSEKYWAAIRGGSVAAVTSLSSAGTLSVTGVSTLANVLPRGDNNIGSLSAMWSNVYTTTLNVGKVGDAAAGTMAYGNIEGIGEGLFVRTSGETLLLLRSTSAWVKNIYPMAGERFNMGSETYRWKGIYLTESPNIVSDRKNKEHVGDVGAEIDEEELLKLIDGLTIRAFKYRDGEGRADDKSLQLGIYINDIRDSPLFEYIGNAEKDENGEETLSMKSGSFAALGLIAAKAALRREKEYGN